ncbi:hypothetical protein L7F22_063155 [Adiantum nelumboides]|nr:hypothetical protein [Adiantum nelumboides]
MKLSLTLPSACLLFILRIIQPVSVAESTSFVFNGFQGNNISLNGVAGIHDRLIKLTNASDRQFGRAFYSSPLLMRGSDAHKVSSFSTTFVFCISPMGVNIGGHGMAFVMAPSMSSDGAFPSQFLGLLNATNNNMPNNHLFAVEFDTLQDLEFADIDDNHVGVNVNSMVSVHAETAGYWTTQSSASHEKFKTEINLKGEKIIQGWIDYDGQSQVLNVSIAPVGSPHPSIPLISVSLDLWNVFEEQMYAGFTAATGVLSGTHRLLAWSFNSNGEAPSLDLSLLPSVFSSPPLSSTTEFKIGISVMSVILLLGVCTLVGLLLYMRSQREVVEGWELEFGLYRFGYKELQKATKKFSDKELLGVGAFGRVYRGVLPKSGVELAVKRLSRESDQGEREFIAEMASTGRLRHRNLVQLLGWSRCRGELLLVYEYMPNRSLDKVLHGNLGKALRWEQRHKILKGIAAGLRYLHEGWEQQVLHRDIKSSNVLLDANMNAKLGDFGLARLYEHGQNPHTTRVVGTLGYLAPEFASTGKANASTDVYSFGVLLLEIVTGRHPVEYQVSVEDFLLVDKVLELYLKGRFLEVADRRLDGLYNVEELKRVIELGLFCVHPDPKRRPSMHQAVQVLTFCASLPSADLMPSQRFILQPHQFASH